MKTEDESGYFSRRNIMKMALLVMGMIIGLAVIACFISRHEPIEPLPAGRTVATLPITQSSPPPDTLRETVPNPPPTVYLPLLEPYSNLRDLTPGTPEADCAARLDALIRAAPQGKRLRALATLRVRLDYEACRGAVTQEALAKLLLQLDAVLAGGDPFREEGLDSLRGYYAANDDSCQPFRLALPKDYTPKQKYPLVLLLHHHGWGDWYRPFQGCAESLPDAIVAAPHGRGSCDYLWIAEDDALAVLEAVCGDFSVDRERVYVTGWSMGGTGSFHLPSRYPDRFAAAAPKAGNADFTAWEEAWKEDRRRAETPYLEPRMFLRWQTAPVTFAENYLHVALHIDHGEFDSINPVGHSRSMAGRLSQLGYQRVFRAGEGGHGWGASVEERYQWMKQFRIPKAPDRVRLKTGDYRHGSAYWVTVDRLNDRMKPVEIDVKLAAAERIEVAKCENLEQFTLRLDQLSVAPAAQLVIAGQRLDFTGRPAELTVRKRGADWGILDFAKAQRPVEPKPFPPPKRKGLEGPIHDAFREPFLLVIGTTAADPMERWAIREEAQRWRRQWRRRFQVWPPVKDDREVKDEDEARRNLVLFGGPHANSITARLMDRLPAKMTGKRVIVGDKTYEGDDLGLKLVYPNPEHPERLIVLQAATTWRGMWQMTHRFGNWFDWMPLDNRDWFDFCVFDDRSEEFETFLDVGFFDEDWSLARANRWRGLAEWRERSRPRNYPRFVRPPADQEVRLSDLWPVQIDTAKGPLQIDRSFNGKELCIGRQPQSHGLGQWIESAVVYNLEGGFRRFRTKVGIDAEGQEKISAARKDVERTTFQVLGDGKLLAEARNVTFDQAPGNLEAKVEGVRCLTLRVLRQAPEGWLYGPIAWGEPVLVK